MSDYDYINAHVRGMHGYLLDREFYDQVLSTQGMDPLVDALLSSPYEFDLREALSVEKGIPAVESAMCRNIARTFAKIRNLTPEKPRRLLNVQFNCWEMANILALMRGKLRGAPGRDIQAALLPVWRLDEPRLIELAEQPDIKAVADVLVAWNHPFASSLRGAITGSMERLDPLAVEIAINKSYFAWALDELRDDDENEALMLTVIKRQIDLVNVKIALSMVRQIELKCEPFSVGIIPGGLMKRPTIERIRNASRLDEALETLDDSFFASGVERGILAFAETGRLGMMERFLEAVVIRFGCKMFRRDPLNISVLIGYIWRKYNDFINLRILLRGKAYGLPVNRIREDLIFI